MRNMLNSAIHLIRISNGYLVSVPIYPDVSFPSIVDNAEKPAPESLSGKPYIPQQDETMFFKTLEEYFGFLKEIEKNPAFPHYDSPMANYITAATRFPA